MPEVTPSAPIDPSQRLDVAIVGAGFSGVACAVQCSRLLAPNAHVALIGAQAPGRGAAYGVSSRRLLMNAPAKAMSAVPHDELDLVKHARVTEHALIPRCDYSEYLQTLLEEATARHAGLFVRGGEIVDIERDDEGYVLHDANGNVGSTRAVILALGNPPPSSTFLPIELREHPGFIANPWTLNVLPDGDVLCIGAGLTAMDIVALADRPGESRVHLISRHGRLPEIEDPYAHAIAPNPFDFDATTPHSMVASMRAAVETHVEEGGDWRDVFETLRPLSSAIWKAWSIRERRQFLRHAGPIWGSLRYRVPPETFAAFGRMRGAGRIAIHRGHVGAALAHDDGTIEIVTDDRGKRSGFRVSVAINCTGPNDDVEQSHAPLIVNLLRRGLTRPHELHMGFDVADDLRLLDAGGNVGGIFGIGPILRGALYETTAVNEIREQAVAVVAALNNSSLRTQTD